MSYLDIEYMVWIFIELAFAGISTVLVYLFVRVFLQQKKVEFNFVNGVIIAAALTIKFFANLYFNENIIIISSASIITAFIIGRFYFRGKLPLAIMSALLTFLSGATAELFVAIFIVGFQTIALSEVMQFGIYRLLSRTVSSLFLLIIIILVGRFRKSLMASTTTKVTLTLCMMPIISIVITQQFMTHIIYTTYLPTISDAIPMISIITINIFIFLLVENIMRQNEKNQMLLLVNTQCDAQQKHIVQLLNTHEQIRQLSHDFKQQADVLYQLCREGHYKVLQDNLSKLSNHPGTLLIVKTGNLMLDSILSSKKADATRQDIDFVLNLRVRPELPYMSMDICILLGNAIDNAIEACMRSNPADRLIELELTADLSRFLFHMKNSIGEAPQVEGEFLKTKKDDNLRHGIGLKSMKQISNKLGGDMTYEYNNEHFAIWIYLPVG